MFQNTYPLILENTRAITPATIGRVAEIRHWCIKGQYGIACHAGLFLDLLYFLSLVLFLQWLYPEQ